MDTESTFNCYKKGLVNTAHNVLYKSGENIQLIIHYCLPATSRRFVLGDGSSKDTERYTHATNGLDRIESPLDSLLGGLPWSPIKKYRTHRLISSR